MKSSRIYLPLIVSLTILIAATSAFAQVAFAWSNVPLDMVIGTYSEWTGKQVDIVRGVNAKITLRTEGNRTLTEAANLVEQELKKHNIGVFAITSNRVVFTWIDRSKVDPELGIRPPRREYQKRLDQNVDGKQEDNRKMSYRERLERRRQELKDQHGKSSNQVSDATLEPTPDTDSSMIQD